MRWDNLFDDLEGQLEHELNAEEIDLRAEEERLRLGRLSVRDRLMSLTGPRGSLSVLRVVLSSGATVAVRPSAFGKDWLAGDLLDGTLLAPQCVLPLAAVAGVVLAAEDVSASLATRPVTATQVVDRIGLPFVLRDLCRRRKALELHTPAAPLFGTIDRVGRDHIDLAVHDRGTARRRGDVQQYRVVPLSQILLVRLE